jgi:hypothetical protein
MIEFQSRTHRADPQFQMDTAVSQSQFQAAMGHSIHMSHDSLPEFRPATPAAKHGSFGGNDSSSSGSSKAHQDIGPQSLQRNLQGTIQQVDRLKADIAGMEAVISAVRGEWDWAWAWANLGIWDNPNP